MTTTQTADLTTPAEVDRWTTADVARHLGVRESTVRGYAARGQMPAPDGRLGRTPWWWDTTITAWRHVRDAGQRTDAAAHYDERGACVRPGCPCEGW